MPFGVPIVDAFREYSAPAAKWQPQSNVPELSRKVIRIVAALVQDEAWRVLLVRKKGTRAFMQPGGKLNESESHLTAPERELDEELGCSFRPGSPVFLGTFTAAAANENGCMVEAALYSVELLGSISAASEIEEVSWLHPNLPHHLELAPLTREHVLPLAARNFSVHRNNETTSNC